MAKPKSQTTFSPQLLTSASNCSIFKILPFPGGAESPFSDEKRIQNLQEYAFSSHKNK